ncbi:zinc-ribbon domain-containing protein [Mycolicibacterium moriokaense]|nr:zinc-ribbon domain-containing protein [Mycolicibacterium moriokaense]
MTATAGRRRIATSTEFIRSGSSAASCGDNVRVDDARCGSCGADVAATAKFCSDCGTPLARARQAAEYKQVTVLFADVVHSMDIARDLGAERLREIMAGLVDSASAAVQRYGGTVDKFTGDGIMAVFGAPLALEDHAVRACLAALNIQQQVTGVQLRIGLNSGQVIAGDIGSGAMGYTAIGEHVGMAQRMESAAPPGGVMLSASTARLVEDVATLSEPELVAIKGEDQPVAARRLLSMDAARTAGRVESNLVGRQWEMSAITGLLDRAIAGYGAVVGLAGPAGIGKSRLTRELAASARERGVQVFTTYCESHTSQVPFHVVGRLLRSASGVDGMDPAAARALIESDGFGDADPADVALFEDLLGIAAPDREPPRIDADTRRRRLTAFVNSATLRSPAPAVYVIEDAHWIDDSSESMLADFLAVVPQTPLLTVITYRPEYRGALAQVPGAQTVALGPLSDAENTALISDLLGDHESVRDIGRTIAERASGTPFFAEEIIRDLAERGILQGKPGAYTSAAQVAAVSVPATLQATIASRIDRLDPKAKRTLNAAAVAGSRFGTELLKDLDIEPAIGELLAAQLIDQVSFTDSPEYVFHHPLIRAVAYEAQLKQDRAELHRRVTASIERRSAESLDENAALIAEHAEAAGDLRAAFGWHMRAGEWSSNRHAAAALASWERACQVADALPDDDPERIRMRIASRTVLCASGWRVRAYVGTRFEELRKLCTEADDKTSLAVAMMGPLSDHHLRGELTESSRLANEQLALLESIGDPGLSAQAAFGAISIKAQSGDLTEVARWADATIDWARGDLAKGGLVVGSPLAIATAFRSLAGWWYGRRGWQDDFESSFALGEKSGEPLTMALICSWNLGLGVPFGAVRADHAAVALSEAAVRAAEASSYDYAAENARYVLGGLLLAQDSPSDRSRGRAMLAQVKDSWERQNVMLSELAIFDMLSGRERADAGDFDQAVALLRKSAGQMLGRGQRTYWILATGVLVETLLDRGAKGDVDEAEAAIAALAAAPVAGSVIRDVVVLRLRALLAHVTGDRTYRDLRDRYRGIATHHGYQGHMAWAEAMP